MHFTLFVARSTALLLIFASPCFGQHRFDSRYPFSLTLSEGNYYLYWNVSFSDETIQFAVRVKTTGWVGFGISPNGQMPGSDVVIGWVDGDNAYFHDRYAESRSTPPIDDMQDWFLISAEINNGYTELEFSRNFTTCDTEGKDLPILADTSRVIYSWNDATPRLVTSPDGYSINFHQDQGSASVNLLGGEPNPPSIPDDAESFTVGVDEIVIPARETTYWCKAVPLNTTIEDVIEVKYVIKYGPEIPTHAKDYVHHILVYTCNGLEPEDYDDEGGPCREQSNRVQTCLGSNGVLIAAWAVGGVDFVYPENVGYPIAGPDSHQFFVIEMHYNNPGEDAGVVDSSGITFTYINERREHEAGVILVGHSVGLNEIIPPRLSNYTVSSMCSMSCTNQFIPETGINVFANTLHTHLAGTGASLTVVRRNTDGTYREVQPIEKNLKYDFNFQQTVNLPQEIKVLPGDILIMNCYYTTSDRSKVTLGGESTSEEMCLSFPAYYPRINMSDCQSFPLFDELTEFVLSNVAPQDLGVWTSLDSNFNETSISAAVDTVTWTDRVGDQLSEAVYGKGSQYAFCYSGSTGEFYNAVTKIPEISEYYTPPSPVRTCGSGATVARVSVIMLLIFVISASFYLLNY